MIHLLDESTINQIAAGEVVERPSAVVKELIENAIDAGASAITVEIKDGGLSLIRITDNGSGIEKEDIPVAFKRHATSKIRTAEDLLTVTSLGFRGEALSSIAAVAQVELITKTPSALSGCRYIIEGGVEKSIEEIGCPSGTTILVRNLFYNTPARRKFLKSPQTEGSYISDLMERIMISHPQTSFKFIINNQVKLQSSGNNNTKDIIYNIYGREVVRELVDIEAATENVKIHGYIAKPIINRGNRNFENYYINGRYIKSTIITKAIEEAYRPYLMQHRYPFVSLYYEIDPLFIDVNVHPQKREIRFKNSEEIYQLTIETIRTALSSREMIPKISLANEKNKAKEKIVSLPEPFEENRRKEATIANIASEIENKIEDIKKYEIEHVREAPVGHEVKDEIINEREVVILTDTKQLTLDMPDMAESKASPFLSKEAMAEHRIIGQIFSTYWLVEYNKELFIIDQHAAHEKVLYERIMAAAKEKTYQSQMLMPPIILTLTLKEQEAIAKYKDTLKQIGYEIEAFGGNEYSVRGVPADLYGLSERELLLEFIDDLTGEIPTNTPVLILEKLASLSCKAAVKANHSFSTEEASSLIQELLTLDNPYNCPHGRPVIISMSQYELEKKFKRIV
ncbi:MAG: DNA mismatch repair endonuclease MutL [Clostridiales bacterium]|nr:DNA mismatch repair endonuclease MutL [Clostridiales bacterium]